MKTLVCIVAIGVATVAGIGTARADFKTIVAQRMFADPALLILNLPPRPDAWPGAIFTSNLRLPIVHGDPKDPALHQGDQIGIETKEALDLAAEAKGGVAGWLGLSVDAKDSADIVMSFPDAHVVDMDVGDLKHHVEMSSEAIDAAKRGQIPLIIVKAYTGTLTLTITRKTGASVQAFAQIKPTSQIGAKAVAESDDSITYRASKPIVFAFETQQISFDAKDLISGKSTIRLASLPSELFAYRQDASDAELAFAVLIGNGAGPIPAIARLPAIGVGNPALAGVPMIAGVGGGSIPGFRW